jgi:hypothetical protein
VAGSADLTHTIEIRRKSYEDFVMLCRWNVHQYLNEEDAEVLG